jgi:hypothetical protein
MQVNLTHELLVWRSYGEIMEIAESTFKNGADRRLAALIYKNTLVFRDKNMMCEIYLLRSGDNWNEPNTSFTASVSKRRICKSGRKFAPLQGKYYSYEHKMKTSPKLSDEIQNFHH